MEYWLSALLMLMEQFALATFYDAFFERRYSKAKFWAFWALCVAMDYILLHLLQPRGQISLPKILLGIAMYLLTNIVLYKGLLVMRALSSVLAYALTYLLGATFQTFAQLLFRVDDLTRLQHRGLWTLVSFGSGLACILGAMLFKRLHKPQQAARHTLGWTVPTLLLPFASLLALLPMYRLMQSDERNVPVVTLGIAILALANVGLLILINWMEQSALEREHALALHERLHAQAESIDALSNAYAAQRRMTHDFHHHLAAALEMLKENEVQQACQYLQELQGERPGYNMMVNTHHAAIDAVLNQKTYYARKQKIDIQFQVNDLSSIKIKNVDCVSVLANLLDNAIEACVKLEPKKRWIEVQVLHSPSEKAGQATLFISVVNASLPVKIVEDRIATTKPEPEFHGYGLPSIQTILARYRAEYVMVYQNECFQFSLEWPDIAL